MHLLDMSSHIPGTSDAPDLDCPKKTVAAWQSMVRILGHGDGTFPTKPGLDRRIFISSECAGKGEVIVLSGLPCTRSYPLSV